MGDEAEPGRLRTQLENVFDRTLLEATGGVKDPLAYFPSDLTSEQKRIVREYWDNLLRTVTDNIKTEFTVICDERNLTSKLNQLDALLFQQPQLQDGSRLPLNFFQGPLPEEVITDRVLRKQRKKTEKLQAELARLEAEALELAQEQETLRAEAQVMIHLWEQSNQDVTNAASIAQQTCAMLRDD